MTIFKTFITFFLYFLFLNTISAQAFISYLYPVADTVYTQSFTPRIHGDHIYVLNATFENGFSGANSIVYVEEYNFDGLQSGHTRVDPVLPQLYQVVNLQPMLWLNDQLLVSTDRITLTEDQHAVLFGFNADISNAWTSEFASNNSISTSGILLPGGENHAFYAYIRTSQITDQDDLALRLINKNGQVVWTKYVPLPIDQQREYFQVMTGTKTQDKIIALCEYTLSGSNTHHLLTILDTTGNLIESKVLPAAGQPLIASRPNSDTFYVTESKRIGTHYYYCLHTYVGSINNLIGTACSDDLNAATSDYESDMRVDQQGNVFTVGSTVLEGDSLPIGHVAKWSSSGALLWKKSYRLGAYPQGVAVFSNLDFASNDKILLSGSGNNNYTLLFPLRFNWLLTLDENGCYDSNCDDLVILDASIVPTKEIAKSQEIDFQVYPSPASTELKLNCPSAGQIRVFDTQGRTILEKSVTSGVLSLPLANYPLGLYFIQFSDSKSATITRKVVIERG